MDSEALLLNETNPAVNGVVDDEAEPKLYRRRWIMLALVTLLTAENLTQWLFYSAIGNIVEQHFGVSSFLTQLLSLNNLAVIMIFGLPSIFVVNKTDLKAGILISGALTLIALWIKFFGAGENGFYLTLCGQIFASLGTCFVLPLPAQLASTWFGIFERCTATSIAASGLSVGMGAAYLFSVQFVPHTKNHGDIKDGIERSTLIQAMICSTTLVAAVFVFEKRPLSPPSRSQAASSINHARMTLLEALRVLLTNVSYVCSALTFGVVNGVLYSFFSLLNNIVLRELSGRVKLMGWMGFMAAVIGIPGMILAGFWLDATKSYKKSFLGCSALIALTTCGFTLAIKYGAAVWLLFVLVGLFGFLTAALNTIGFVLAGELTYPVPEMFSSGVLLFAGQIFGVLLLAVTSYTITAASVEFVNWLLTAACFVALLFTPFVKEDYRRLAEDVSDIAY